MRIGYALINYMKNGHEVRELANLGRPLNFEGELPVFSSKGHSMKITSRRLRVYDDERQALKMAEQQTALRFNPAQFATGNYRPGTDIYELQVVPVRLSQNGLVLGEPLFGVSHALGTFSFDTAGKRVLTNDNFARFEKHKAQRARALGIH